MPSSPGEPGKLTVQVVDLGPAAASRSSSMDVRACGSIASMAPASPGEDGVRQGRSRGIQRWAAPW